MLNIVLIIIFKMCNISSDIFHKASTHKHQTHLKTNMALFKETKKQEDKINKHDLQTTHILRRAGGGRGNAHVEAHYGG